LCLNDGGKIQSAFLKEVCQAQEETHQFRQEVEEKFDAFIAKFKREVNVAQKITDDFARKISSTNYQFKKKGQL